MWDADRRVWVQDDSRAITTILGAMFVFSFIVILLSVNQAQVVPQQNSEVEFQHFQDVRSDMVKVRTAILSASRTDTVQYTTVSLGTTYPSRVIAMNPPPPTGTLRTTEKHNIIIEGETRKEIGTRFIEYRPGYNELNVGPIRYENSVLYLDQREGSGGVAIIEEQNIVTNNSNKARIPVLKKEYSESSAGRVAIKIQPVGEETKTVGVVPDDQGNVSISIPTRLSGDYWNRSDVPVDGFVSSSDGINRVNITRSIDSVEFNTVGADSAPDGIDIEAEINRVRPVENATGGPLAYRDRDNDLQYDDGETTYTKDELNDFDKNVNLVIPPDVGTISDGGISIEADNITSRADYRTDSSGVKFSTDNTDGVIDLATSTVGSSNGGTTITGGSDAILIRTDIASGGLDVTAGEISAKEIDVSTNNSGIDLTSEDGPLNIPESELTTTNGGGVTLSDIDGPADLTGATIESASGGTTITQASSSKAKVVAQNANITSGGLDVTAGEISATGVVVSTNNSGIDLTSEDGPLDIPESELTTTNGGGVTLSDIDGPADLTGATIESASGGTTITQASSSKAKVVAQNANITSGGLDVTAGEISATGVVVSTNNSGIDLTSEDGPLDIPESELTTTNGGGVTLSDIDGPADLTGATIESASGGTTITQASSSKAKVVAQNANITSGGLDVTAGEISATGVVVSTNNSGIDLTSEDGPLDIPESELTTTNGGGVTLSDIDGPADLTGATIESASGGTTITQASSSKAKVVAQNANITSGGLDVTAGEISATGVVVSTNNSGIDLTSEDGPLNIPESELTATNSDITIDSKAKIAAKTIFIDSSGKVQLCAEKNINIADGSGDSKIITQGTADADFRSKNGVFTVNGVEITTNNDDKMTYSPSSVTVSPDGDGTNSTESGKVVPTNSGRSSLC